MRYWLFNIIEVFDSGSEIHKDVLISGEDESAISRDNLIKFALEWCGYDYDDDEFGSVREDHWDDKDESVTTNESSVWLPILHREITAVEAKLFEVVRRLAHKEFTLDDFMALQEEA